MLISFWRYIISKEESDKLVKMIYIQEEGLEQEMMGFVKEVLESWAVNHKAVNSKAVRDEINFVPATNLISQWQYLGIKNIFDKNGFDYSGSTIIEASKLKTTLEK
jgi:hypothetical protein